MLKIRHVLEDDKPFWTAIDGHISINELELKIRDKRGYVIGANMAYSKKRPQATRWQIQKRA